MTILPQAELVSAMKRTRIFLLRGGMRGCVQHPQRALNPPPSPPVRSAAGILILFAPSAGLLNATYPEGVRSASVTPPWLHSSIMKFLFRLGLTFPFPLSTLESLLSL